MVRPTVERPPETAGTLEIAQGYARRGWPIVPLVGKVPAVRNCRAFAATPVNVRFWCGTRRCNVGLRTGESVYVVVDTDTPEAEDWVRTHLPDTPMVALSGNGSTHRYFGAPPRKEVRKKQGWKGIRGLDIRGHGGYVVLPGSVHPETGRRYEWRSGILLPSGLPVFSPCWVYERQRAVRTAVADALDPAGVLARGRRYVDALPVAKSGCGGHTTTFVAAMKIARLAGFDRDLAWRLLLYYNATRCEPEWRAPELLHKLDEGLKHARRG
jgi:hypothetical protein